MRPRFVPALLVASAFAATGGAAYAIAGSVSTSPDPLYISPTSPGGLSDHPDTEPRRTSTSAVTSTTAPAPTTSTPATVTIATTSSVTAPESSTTVTTVDDHGGDRGGHGSEDVAGGDDGSGDQGSHDQGSGDHGGDDHGGDGHGGHGSDD